MRGRSLSYLLVAIQFASLAVFPLTGPWLARATWLLAIEVGGVALGAWALLTVGLADVHVLPDVRPGARFVRQGPYRWIRHPMYAALLIVAGALTIDHPSTLRVVALSVLLIDILVKLHYEEGLLAAAFPEYAQYRQETKRLVPFVY